MQKLILFSLVICSLVNTAFSADSWLWETDVQEHRPSLRYPVSFMLTAHVVGIVWLNSLDHEDTGFSKPSARNFADAWTRGPVFDEDEWYFNYLAHPLWGSETYLRVRSQGFDPFSSFLFSTGSSVLWEFVFESWSVRPSYQDLMLTSTTGAVLGEFRYKLKRHLLSVPEPNYYLVALVDPLQTISEYAGIFFLGTNWTEPAYRRVAADYNPEDPRVNLDVGVFQGELGLVLQYHKRF